MALTKRQKEVLDFIANFVDEHGYCPSYDEIAKGLDLASLATVHKHISVLEGKNYLKRGFNQSRSLELSARYVQEQRRTKAPAPEIPLLGRIAAGAPVEAVEQRETLNFADFAGNGNTFALEVRGNSMIDDHICDGDLILLEKVAQAHDGDIVVALVAGSEKRKTLLIIRQEALASYDILPKPVVVQCSAGIDRASPVAAFIWVKRTR